MTKQCLLILLLFSFLSFPIRAQTPDKQGNHTVDRSSPTIPTPIHGVTVADNRDIRKNKYLNEVVESVSHLTSTPTVRLTYKLEGSDGNKGAKASTYLSATQEISKKAYIFGEVIDSAYEFCFDVRITRRAGTTTSRPSEMMSIYGKSETRSMATGSTTPIRSR